MIKKGILLFMALLYVVLSSGCETVKGASDGARKDYENAKKADKWMQDNLW